MPEKTCQWHLVVSQDGSLFRLSILSVPVHSTVAVACPCCRVVSQERRNSHRCRIFECLASNRLSLFLNLASNQVIDLTPLASMISFGALVAFSAVNLASNPIPVACLLRKYTQLTSRAGL